MFFGKNKAQQKKKSFLYSSVEFVLLLLFVFFVRTFFFGLYQVPTGSMEKTMLVGERFFADKLSFIFRNPVRGEIIAFNDPVFPYSKDSKRRLFQHYVWGPSNWTKRVIGIPGDHVKGTVENGVPVVYLNGKKLEESYINPYPLIHVWSQDPEILRSRERETLIHEGYDVFSQEERVNAYIEYKISGFGNWKTYDPTRAYDDQLFYKLSNYFIEKNNTLKMPYEPVGSNDSPHSHNQQGRAWNGSDEFEVQLSDNEYWCMGDNRRGSWDCRGFGPLKRELIHGRILFRIISIDSTDSWLIFDLLKNPLEFWSRVRWNRFLQRVS